MPSLCTFEGCVNKHNSHGLCGPHGRQVRLGQELRPLRKTSRKGESIQDGKKHCGGCLQWLPIEMFGPLRSSPDGYQSRCRRCVKNANLIRTYGITIDEYDTLLTKQGGLCATCCTATDESLYVDHDHACCETVPLNCGGKCIRGLLCNRCNTVLGKVKDDPTLLVALAEYLAVPRF